MPRKTLTFLNSCLVLDLEVLFFHVLGGATSCYFPFVYVLFSLSNLNDFWSFQRSVKMKMKMKVEVIFFSSSGIGTRSVELTFLLIW